MKKFTDSLVVRIVALVLLGALLLGVVLGIAGIVVLFDNGVYGDGGTAFRVRLLSRVNDYEMGDIYAYTTAYLNHDMVSLKNYDYGERYSRENSNLYFRVVSEEGEVVLSNESSVYPEDTYLAEFIRVMRVQVWHELDPNDSLYETESFAAEDMILVSDESRYTEMKLTLYTYIRSNLVAHDLFYTVMRGANILISMRYALPMLVILMAILWLADLILVLTILGHKRGREGITLTWFDRVPLEIVLFGLFLIILMTDQVWDSFYNIIAAIVLAAVIAVCFFTALFTFTVRVKAGGWWRNTLTYRIGRVLARGLYIVVSALGKIHLYWSSALLILVVFAFDIVFLDIDQDVFLIWWVIKSIVGLAVVIALAHMFRRLEKSGEELARGNIEYKTDLRLLIGPFRRHGEHLNGISDGLARALEEQMKSERMRTELITNVSHDIKTPLTSIINYVDLLKKEGMTSPHAEDYLAVIDRQSARLRKLTEDLIEASKASVGAIQVNAERTDVNVLLSQAAGEYESKLRERGLQTVMTLAADDPVILTDGRLLWRVFDNLFGNIVKYALEGTRVYLSTEKEADNVRIVFRNISGEPLNIPGEELMERFVRGDVSRNTEGSGLGLSIAGSLTTLQGGRFSVETDGDLFKATLIFPICS